MKKLAINLILPLVLAALLSGCGANFNSIYRDTDGNQDKVAFTDAKQSATIISVKDGLMRACAAKSPDVFQALSTAASGSMTLEDALKQFALSLSGAGSSAESAAAFGLRTQLTQSQSELLYQLCINALNETITPDQLATELHRYQNTMVTMLGIEQLTGHANATVVALGGAAQTGNADAVEKLQDKLDKAQEKEGALLKASNEATASREAAKKAVEVAEANKTSKQSAYDAAKKKLDELKAADPKPKPEDITAQEKLVNTADTELGQAKTNLTKAQAELEANQVAEKNASAAYQKQIQTRKNIEKSLNAARNSQSTTAQSAVPVISDAQATATVTSDIAKTVLEMQKVHLHQTFTTDECLHFLFHPDKERFTKFSPGQLVSLENLCKAHLEEVDSYSRMALYLEQGCALSGTKDTGINVTCESSPNTPRIRINDVKTYGGKIDFGGKIDLFNKISH